MEAQDITTIIEGMTYSELVLILRAVAARINNKLDDQGSAKFAGALTPMDAELLPAQVINRFVDEGSMLGVNATMAELGFSAPESVHSATRQTRDPLQFVRLGDRKFITKGWIDAYKQRPDGRKLGRQSKG